MPVKSKAQAGLFGLIAGGGDASKAPGLSKSKAKEWLRGVKVKSLPEHAKQAFYASQDETIGDWAQRQLESLATGQALEALEQAVPQTPPVVSPEVVTFHMRELADELDEAVDLGMLPPAEVMDALSRIHSDLDAVLHWLKEAT